MPADPEFPEPAPANDADQGRVADAVARNWVDDLAPRWLRPWLRLSRADRPIGTWLLFIPCLWGVSLAALQGGFRQWDLWLALSCGIGAFLMRGAGCTWNDITDRGIDGQVARTRSRPIPSGQVSVRGALIWMILQALAAAVILFSYNRVAVGLGVLSLVLVAVYPFAKRFTWWPQIFLGLAFNWGALLGFAAHAGVISAGAVALYVAGVFWTLWYDTIYAHQDSEDDALIGVRSTARLFGAASRQWLWGFLVATLLVLTLAVALAQPEGLLALLAALAGIWAMGWQMVLTMRRLDLDDAQSCLVAFRGSKAGGLWFALLLAVAAAL